MKSFLTTASIAGLMASFLVVAGAAAQTPQLPAINEPASGLQFPGKFIWFDLATPAIQAQQNFYSHVFGWTFRSPIQTEDQYLLVVKDGRAIAGMFSYEPPDGEQDGATWIGLMSVPDTGQAEQTVKANGGSVEVGPTQVAGRGRHALFRDPAGAIFGVLKSDSGDPPDYEVEIGGVFWVDLYARDIEQMAEFYGALAPYEVQAREIADTVPGKVLAIDGVPRAGMVAVDEEANRTAWVPYIRVADVAATLAKVEESGGFAIVPPDEKLLDGNLAVFVDPNGGVTGIVKWEYTEEFLQ
jgi:predicted enzyme related to lactoylglutathione lyase